MQAMQERPDGDGGFVIFSVHDVRHLSTDGGHREPLREAVVGTSGLEDLTDQCIKHLVC
jgi:hypothetical protein